MNGPVLNDYGPEVARRFAEPRFSGSLPGAVAVTLRSRARDAEICFQALVDDRKRLKRLRFQAIGCPHLVAAADLLAERLEGAAVVDLQDFRAGFLETELPLPAEKLDLKILLEDAIKALYQAILNESHPEEIAS
ncbi:MAG: iron-sulfur cluster assembly scaffold protein [Gammaproteobacteria bacterium]|nr:iron-sulfur cluster assembly scaffold protein [Gammaproteobacteria bacterium]